MINNNETNRFSGIISAVEFFSQRFELEQIIQYAFKFSKDLLVPNNIALWSLHDSFYTISNQSGYQGNFLFEYHEQYNDIVYFHAGLLYKKEINKLLPPEITLDFNPDFCIPLIMDKTFFGFVALRRTKENPFSPDDEMIANTLMNLFSISLTAYNAYKKLETTKAKLDEKIFNLFAINQSTKALLSELSLPNLCDLAIGIFSELTQSCFTTFFIKDPIRENYRLMSYKNVRDHKLRLDLTLFQDTENVSSLPVLIDMSKENSRNLFISNFFNGHEIIEKINPHYIVLLKKNNQLVGFVTLGSKINDTVYDTSIFELVESLTSSTYIAINNAFYIEKIEEQRNLIHNQLNELVKLNQLMKNINTAQTYEQIISLVMNTLDLSYGIDMSFFSLYNKQNQIFTIIDWLNIKETFNQIEMNPSLLTLLDGDPIFVYEDDKIPTILPDIPLDVFMKPVAGMIMIPVYIKNIEIELIGFFALFHNRSKNLIVEGELLTFETIASHIAPVIYQLQSSEKIKSIYTPNYSQLFLEAFKEELNDAIQFNLDLFVVHIKHLKDIHFFQNSISKKLFKQFKNTYNIDYRNTFIITNTRFDLDFIKDILNQEHDYAHTVYRLHEDYTNYSSFLELF